MGMLFLEHCVHAILQQMLGCKALLAKWWGKFLHIGDPDMIVPYLK